MGLLRWRDWGPLGISRRQVQVRLWEVAPGIVSHAPRSVDATSIAAKRVPHAVVCLHSALYFHGLREEPPEVWLAIAEKARKPKVEQPRLRIVRFSGLALERGRQLHQDAACPTRVYSVAKTVADLFKYRRKVGELTAMLALHDALRAGLCTVEDVRYYAVLCRVTRPLEACLATLESLGGVPSTQVARAMDALRPPSERIPRMPWLRRRLPERRHDNSD
jgi:hypothetical protein